MGGGVSTVARIFKSLVVIKPAQAVAAPVATQAVTPIAAATNIAQKATLAGGTYGGQTILSSSQGDEKEANVSKTILGGGKKKIIKS